MPNHGRKPGKEISVLKAKEIFTTFFCTVCSCKKLDCERQKKKSFFLSFQGYLLFQRICNEIIGRLLEQPELFKAF